MISQKPYFPMQYFTVFFSKIADVSQQTSAMGTPLPLKNADVLNGWSLIPSVEYICFG